MALGHNGVERAALPHAQGVDRAVALDVGLFKPGAVDVDLAAGIDHNPIAGDGDDAFDVGVTGWIGNSRDAVDDRQVGEDTTQRADPSIGAQNRIEMVRGTEDNDLAPLRCSAAQGEFLHQQAILQLQSRKHRARGDVARLQDVMAYPEGDAQGDQNPSPEHPGAFLGWLFPAGCLCWIVRRQGRGCQLGVRLGKIRSVPSLHRWFVRAGCLFSELPRRAAG